VKYESVAVINGRVVGHVGQAAGKYVLRYEHAWRYADGAFPLSLSLPLTREEHGDDAVRPYLANLLPDNDTVLRAWARRYQVSASNPLALLAHVGEECPGALQLLPPERADELLGREGRAPDVVEWLSEDEVGARLRRVLEEPARGASRAIRDSSVSRAPSRRSRSSSTGRGGGSHRDERRPRTS
jgi:serine/threonine-protein kinase HipA